MEARWKLLLGVREGGRIHGSGPSGIVSGGGSDEADSSFEGAGKNTRDSREGEAWGPVVCGGCVLTAGTNVDR